jgi:3-hydroxybutyryl-CoA dehydrogenase
MKIAVVADEPARQEWLSRGLPDDTEIVWLENPGPVTGAGAYIDLLFDSGENRIAEWKEVNDTPVLINDVLKSSGQLPQNVVRMNGWPTFAGRAITEAARVSEEWKIKTTAVLAACNRTVEWVPDIPGFITGRVVSMIINEAWYALEEGVTSKGETDTAMKLGTNYPYGPFDWGERIGLANIYRLLHLLAADNPRYTPCALLKKQVLPE